MRQRSARLDPERFEQLAAALHCNTELANLDLGSSGLGAKHAGCLARLLGSNLRIVRLELANNSFAAADGVEIARSLEGVVVNIPPEAVAAAH